MLIFEGIILRKNLDKIFLIHFGSLVREIGAVR